MNHAESKFSIVHINLRGFRANWQSLLQYLESIHLPDVVTINESKLNHSIDVHLPHYFCASRRDSSHGHHGSLIFVKNGICDVHDISHLKEKYVEEVIGIRINGKSIRPTVNVCTYYNPPGNYINPNILHYCSKLKGSTFILGDLNCKNAAWGSTRDDPQGDHLLHSLNDHNFAILNDGNMTRSDPIYGTEQVLDIAACNFSALSYFRKFTVGHDVGSDHFPLVVDSMLSSFSSCVQLRNWKKADWQLYKNILEQHSSHSMETADDVDCAISSLTSIMNEAIDQACPLVNARFSNSSKFTPEMLSIVKEKRSLRRKKCNAVRNGNHLEVLYLQKLINRKSKDLKKLQQRKHQTDLTQKCHELNTTKNSARFFRLFDELSKSKKGKTHQNSPLVREDGSNVETDKEKSEVFATHLEKCHQISEYHLFDNKWRNEVENYVKEKRMAFQVDRKSKYAEAEPGDDSMLISDISAEEVIENLRHCKDKSAPGEDKISYRMLKKSPANVFSLLSSIYSTCLRLRYFPKAWKKATVTMLPKPGKDCTVAKNNRPISLLSCMGKVYERIVANRLSSFMERKKLFCPYQSGFRKGRMTAEQLLHLIEESSIAIKKKQITAALFLDAEAAFDQAWQDGIRYKLHNHLKLPQRLVRLLSSFLTDRSLTVKVGNDTSREVKMAAGTPQGSCLSPLLYIILVNDIPEKVTESGSLSQFADDIGIWSRAYTFRGATSKLQKSIDCLEGWCRRWRIKLNPSKSNLLFIRRLPEKMPEDICVQLFDGVVKPCTSAKFLGLEIDERLTFSKHIDEKIKSAKVRLNLFQMLSRGGVDNTTLIRLYKTYIRPLIEYGCLATLMAKDESIQKFQKVQNEFIRICLNLPRYIRTTLLHEAACLETIKERMTFLGRKHFTNIRKLSFIEDMCHEFKETIALNNFKCPLDFLVENSTLS